MSQLGTPPDPPPVPALVGVNVVAPHHVRLMVELAIILLYHRRGLVELVLQQTGG
jgi:hypothetical protein